MFVKCLISEKMLQCLKANNVKRLYTSYDKHINLYFTAFEYNNYYFTVYHDNKSNYSFLSNFFDSISYSDPVTYDKLSDIAYMLEEVLKNV